VLYDPARERVLLTYRKRRPRGSPVDRGYECCVAESKDGTHFDELWSVRKEQLGTTSMERFNLHRDPDGRWRIDVIEADRPDGFEVDRAQTVLTAAGTGTAAVKDPYVLRAGPAYYMFVSTFLTDAGPAPTSLAVSLDGVRFRWLGETLGVGEGWDRYQARLSGILRTDTGFVGFYYECARADGSHGLRLAASRSNSADRSAQVWRLCGV
jgi:hypothetical protein